MTPRTPPTPGKLVTVAVLSTLGRVTLVLALAYSLTHALWGFPPDVRRIYGGLLAAALMLGVAAQLLGDPAWLFQSLAWGGAVACVIFLGTVIRMYLHRSPHGLARPELYSAAAALGFLVPAFIFLRRASKTKRHGKTRK